MLFSFTEFRFLSDFVARHILIKFLIVSLVSLSVLEEKYHHILAMWYIIRSWNIILPGHFQSSIYEPVLPVL
jgi:hypothetical protein